MDDLFDDLTVALGTCGATPLGQGSMGAANDQLHDLEQKLGGENQELRQQQTQLFEDMAALRSLVEEQINVLEAPVHEE